MWKGAWGYAVLEAVVFLLYLFLLTIQCTYFRGHTWLLATIFGFSLLLLGVEVWRLCTDWPRYLRDGWFNFLGFGLMLTYCLLNFWSV